MYFLREKNLGCGGVLTSQQGSFASPGYPEPYHHNAVCTWQIQVSKGSRVHLVFVDVDLEIGEGCRCLDCHKPFFNNKTCLKIGLGLFNSLCDKS